MESGSGCFAAIRNPLGHLPNDEIELSEQSALERLCAFSLLARFIEDADLVEEPPAEDS
ncbi:TIGR02391 family protein [Nocardia sp. NPDC050193]